MAFVVPLLAIWSCGTPEARDLETLVVRDSTYVDPESGQPYTGPVYRPFPGNAEDRARSEVQIEGALLDGQWDGEFAVYHPNGRIRYMGTFDAGLRCGAWTENADSTEVESVYAQLTREIESLGIYPPCSEDED